MYDSRPSDVPSDATTTRTGPLDELLGVLAAGPRRVVLSAVLADGAPVPEAVLVDHLDRKRPNTTASLARTRSAVLLSHVHLPVLSDADLVTRTAAGVAPTDCLRWLAERESVLSVIDGVDGVPPEAVDRSLDLLSHPTRRAAVATLAVDRSLTLDALAKRLAARPTLGTAGDDAVQRVEIELHHTHVPKLVDAGVVDRDDRRLYYLGNALLDEWWFAP